MEVYTELKWNSALPLNSEQLIKIPPNDEDDGGANISGSSSNASIDCVADDGKDALPIKHASAESMTDGAAAPETSANAATMAASTNAKATTNATTNATATVSSSTIATMPLHADNTALLVVDVQPEYWSHCPAVREDFPHFPDKLAQTVETCRKRNINKIIWVRADYRYSHSPWLVQFARIHQMKIFESKTMRDEIPCDPNSADFTWETFATPQGGDVIIPKSSWSSTSNTSLMDVLRMSGIDTVLVCGLITSVCVQHSAFGLFEAGYRTILVTDSCADRGMARHQAALALYGDYMYELVTSDDLEIHLKASQPVWVTPHNISRVSPLLTPVSSAMSLNRMDSVASSMSAMTLGPPASGVMDRASPANIGMPHPQWNGGSHSGSSTPRNSVHVPTLAAAQQPAAISGTPFQQPQAHSPTMLPPGYPYSEVNVNSSRSNMPSVVGNGTLIPPQSVPMQEQPFVIPPNDKISNHAAQHQQSLPSSNHRHQHYNALCQTAR